MKPILAIDPGTTKSAWVLFDPDSMHIISKGYGTNEALHEMFFEREFDTYISCLVIEMVQSMGMPLGQTVLKTCVWIGRFEELFFPLPHYEIFRTTIKAHLCGTTRAKDPNVRQALIDKIGEQGTKKDPGPTFGVSGDIWSALAVAVVFSEQLKAGGSNGR